MPKSGGIMRLIGKGFGLNRSTIEPMIEPSMIKLKIASSALRLRALWGSKKADIEFSLINTYSSLGTIVSVP